MKPQTIGIYGHGRLGSALAVAFERSGHDVAVADHSTGVVAFVESLASGSVVFLTVRDGGIAEIAEAATEAKGASAMTFVHCSGATTMSALDSLASVGASVGGFHPLQSFPPKGTDGAADLLQGCFVGVAGDERLNDLARSVGAIPFALADESRVLYHAAAVMASNALAGMLIHGEALLRGAGFGDASAQMLLPLVEGTLANAKRLGAKQALTGPVMRGDADTLRKHVAALPDDVRKHYIALMRAVADASGTDAARKATDGLR